MDLLSHRSPPVTYDAASMQSTSDSTNMGWIWSGSCGAGGIYMYTLVTHISSNHVHFCVGFALRPLLPSALCCQNSKGEGCLLSLISSFPSSPSLFTFTTFYCTVLIPSITSCVYIYQSLNAFWEHCLTLHHMMYLSSHMTCYLVM